MVWQLSYQRAFKKPELVKLCVAILILKMEENTQHFRHIMLYYFKKGKNATEMRDSCSVWRGCVTDQMCQKWFVKFRAGDFSPDDDAPWSGRQRSNRDMSWEQSTLYHGGDSWHTQNIHINKVIGEKWKMSFILQKKLNELFDQPNICLCGLFYLVGFLWFFCFLYRGLELWI